MSKFSPRRSRDRTDVLGPDPEASLTAFGDDIELPAPCTALPGARTRRKPLPQTDWHPLSRRAGRRRALGPAKTLPVTLPTLAHFNQ